MTTQQIHVGPRIVRAWFDSVINPLIDALGSEMTMLRDRNFTWRFRPAGFEWIRRISNHLDSRVWPNLEQFGDLNPSIKAVFRSHDECVEALQKDVEALQDAITGSQEFRQQFDSITSSDSLQKMGVSSPAELFGAYPREDWLKVIAQYVINRSDELQFHYATARLWNSHRSDLLEVLRSPAIDSRYASALLLAGKLSEVDAALLDQLRDLRLKLALEHDQPFVEAESYRP